MWISREYAEAPLKDADYARHTDVHIGSVSNLVHEVLRTTCVFGDVEQGELQTAIETGPSRIAPCRRGDS